MDQIDATVLSEKKHIKSAQPTLEQCILLDVCTAYPLPSVLFLLSLYLSLKRVQSQVAPEQVAIHRQRS